MSKETAGRKGGMARAEILPPERKSEIARIGAIARWSKDLLQAESIEDILPVRGISIGD